MKILVIAYACEPNRGSEPGIGWNWVRQVGKQQGVDITVITRANNRKVIEEFYKLNPDDGIEFIYYDLPQVILKHKKGDKGIKLFFTLWQIGVVKFIKTRQLEKSFDIIWDFNFGSLALPTFCYMLGKKFFIGPVSTKESIPEAYIRCMNFKERTKYRIQHFMRTHLWTNPFTWYALNNASFILTCNEMSRKYLPKGSKSISVFHNGLDLSENVEVENHIGKPLHLIYSGRLIKSKNIALAIEAINQLNPAKGKLVFSIYGNGPEKNKLEALVNKYGMEDIIEFCPKVIQKDLFEVYKSGDIYLFPSLLEISSTSVMEAMYFGLLPICLNIDCMDYIFDNDAVIKVDNISFEEDSKNLAKAIKVLYDDRKLLLDKRIECRNIARDGYVWSKKDDEIRKVVDELEKGN